MIKSWGNFNYLTRWYLLEILTNVIIFMYTYIM